MSFAYIGTSGTEVAMLVSLFSIHVSKFYKQTKLPVFMKIIPSLRSAQWSDFCKRKESERDSLQVSECLRPECFQPKGSRLCGATNSRWLNGTEWWATETQRQAKDLAHWWKLSHCQREDRRVKVHQIAKSTVHEIISDLNFCKVSAFWVWNMLTEYKAKEWLLRLKNLAVTKRENHLWKAMLRDMKHGFTSSP
jgi:hypothetical protein